MPPARTPADAARAAQEISDTFIIEGRVRAVARENSDAAALDAEIATDAAVIEDDADLGAAFGSPFPSPQEIAAAKTTDEPQEPTSKGITR